MITVTNECSVSQSVFTTIWQWLREYRYNPSATTKRDNEDGLDVLNCSFILGSATKKDFGRDEGMFCYLLFRCDEEGNLVFSFLSVQDPSRHLLSPFSPLVLFSTTKGTKCSVYSVDWSIIRDALQVALFFPLIWAFNIQCQRQWRRRKRNPLLCCQDSEWFRSSSRPTSSSPFL